MTMTKAIIKDTPEGIDVKVGYDEDKANETEKALAIELSFVLNEYLFLKQRKGKEQPK